jgi:two-component system, NarL family, nitrate/nitrite response regulator NarL
MSELAARVRTALRVAVVAADARRSDRLRGIVAELGHRPAVSPVEADVVLADGDFVENSLPVVSLGGREGDPAGLLPFDADHAQIDAALRAVAAGLRVRLDESGFDAMAESNLRGLLTPREIEVVGAMAEGLSNKEIAHRLEISPHTVKFHVEAIFRKLGVRSRAEAVARGLQRLEL